MDLQTVFYVVGIVFMVVMLILVGLLLTAVLVIRARILAVERSIEHKFNRIKLATSGLSVLPMLFKRFVRR